MRALRALIARLVPSVSRRLGEDRMREEFETHVALQTEHNLRAGLSPVDARRQALVTFGPVEGIKEQWRDQQRLPVLEQFVGDVRYTFRQFRKAPVFTGTALLSLALGIGANTAVFTVAEHAFMRFLPVADPQELVFVSDQRSQEDQSPRFSYPFYTWFRENRVLEGTAARFGLTLNATINGHIHRIRAELVSGNYFAVVGAATHSGRPLTQEDDRTPGAHAVAVISDGFWRRTFGSDLSVLGRDIRLNEHTFTVIGIGGPRFIGTDAGSPTDIWIPLAMQREVGRDLLHDGGTNWLEIFGRLDPARTRGQAAAELTAYLDQRAPDASPENAGRRLILLPGGTGHSAVVQRELRPALRVLTALTVLAMLLACVNVANLMTLRSAAREREIAVRVALGAGRARLTRQFLTETLVLATLAGVAAVLAAPWTAHLVVASQPHPVEVNTSVTPSILLFAFVLSSLSAVVVALVPIFSSRKAADGELLGHSVGLLGSRRRRPTLRDLTVTLQVAMSAAMLITAGLLIQSLRGLKSVDTGFRADDQLLVTLDPAGAGYSGDRLERFWREAIERISQLRGVQSVSLARTVPFVPERQRQPWLNPTSGEVAVIDTNFVGPDYFRTLDVPLVSGREFTARDGKATRQVAIVNERLARMFWPREDPVGKGLRLASPEDFQRKGPAGPPAGPLPEVIGVVRDVKYHDLRGDALPMVYRPLFQAASLDAMTLHVRAARDASALVWPIRSEMQRLDSDVALFGISTLEAQLERSFAQTRGAARLTGVFGSLALLLSGLGVYGVTALAASRRTRELGVRVALGAHRRHIVALVGGRGVMLTVTGLSLGLLISGWFARFAETLLFGVTATGRGTTYLGTVSLIGVVSLIGCCIPVRAATRLDVAEAIRHE